MNPKSGKFLLVAVGSWTTHRFFPDLDTAQEFVYTRQLAKHEYTLFRVTKTGLITRCSGAGKAKG